MRILRLIALFVAGVAFAQQPSPLPVAPSAAKSDFDSPADYSKDPWVVEYQMTSYHFENDGTGTREVVARIRVQSDAAVQALGQLIVGYSAGIENVEIKYVRVRKADGSVITAPDSAVQDLTAPIARENPVYTDYRQKHITVPGLRPGEVLEYDFLTKMVQPLAPGQFWMEHDFMRRGIVLDEQLQLDIPKSRVVKLKTGAGFDPKETVQGDRKIYTWKTSYTKRDDDDDDKKDDAKKQRNPRLNVPAVQMTTFSSWEEMGRWYAPLVQERIAVTPELKARADELTKSAATDIDKIHVLYDYVARNFRYVSLSFGLGRYQPHAAAEVFANQYGDCKDKHTLLAGLLKAEGFNASTVLINSGRKIDPDVPSPSQFDHVITMVPFAGKNLWMDTTTEIAPFQLLMYQLRKKQALVVPASGAPGLMETPADSPVPNDQLTDVEGKISELGKLTAHVKITFSGDSELPLRAAFRQTPQMQWKELGKAIAFIQGLRGEAKDVTPDDPAKSMGPYHVEYTVEVPNFLEWSKRNSQLALPMTPLRLPELTDADETSPDPFEIGAPGKITYRLKLQLPANFSARAPLPFSMSRDYADYKATYTLDGNNFTAERTANLRWREMPTARLRDYAAFRRAVVADENQTLALETAVAGNGTPKPPEGVKADELYEAAISAYQAQNYQAAVELFKRVTELEPKHKSAWNDLGSAYLATRQIDNAITALNRAIESNPYHEYAYNNLGRAYWEKRDYAKAAEAFRKQIDVNPLDKFAHRNLGSMLLEQKKWSEAMPELEKTVQLASDDALAYVNLGTAQLELGQDDKALESFDRAVNITPAPVVWNNIAYQLSLKNVHLDRAQRYAESAVAATAATLRNLTADHMEYEQQSLVVSIGAYWDTLGWVFFQRGDLDKAEGYVKAAWVLGQHGEVGDHLAQIYEKRGDKQKAMKQYALSLVAYKPEPETRGRLVKLAGSDKAADALLEPARKELAAMSQVPMGPLMKDVKEPLKADFWVVLSPGPKVDDVRFVSGSDKLKEFTEALRSANYAVAFPDNTPTRLLRKGTLSCDKECVFKLSPADDVGGAE
jgi:tetratricopeptide (TPR) repeat protein/transglutaminase-like putative cysteine protease